MKTVEWQGNRYRITECKKGKPVREIAEGDALTDFRGEEWVFLKLTRGPEYNGTAKVYVQSVEDSWKAEYYERVFDLVVEPVS